MMGKLKLYYTRGDDGEAQVWLGTQAPEKDEDGIYDDLELDSDCHLDVRPIVPACELCDLEDAYLLRALRPKGIRKGQCVELTLDVKARVESTRKRASR